MNISRVIFDTNVYLSFLLSPDPESGSVGVLLAEVEGRSFELLLPIAVIAELNMVVARRRHISDRVSPRQIELLFRRITEHAVLLPLLSEEPPRVCHDPNDDFLIALAILHRADFLVTRDQDLLSLGSVLALQIVDPATFLGLISPDPEAVVPGESV